MKILVEKKRKNLKLLNYSAFFIFSSSVQKGDFLFHKARERFISLWGGWASSPKTKKEGVTRSTPSFSFG